MPTTQPLGRNSIAESSLPPNLRKKRKSGNTIINSSVNNVYNAKNKIVLNEDIGAFKPIAIFHGIGYLADKSGNIASAISIDAGIEGAEIEIAKTGDIIKFDSDVFTTNELIWLGSSNDLTQEPDFEDGDYQQVLGMAISANEMFVNIESIYYTE